MPTSWRCHFGAARPCWRWGYQNCMRGVENQSCQGFWKNEKRRANKFIVVTLLFWRCPCQSLALPVPKFGAGRANRRKTRLCETVGAARAKLALPVPKLALPVPKFGAASTLLALPVPKFGAAKACRASLLALPSLWEAPCGGEGFQKSQYWSKFPSIQNSAPAPASAASPVQRGRFSAITILAKIVPCL